MKWKRLVGGVLTVVLLLGILSSCAWLYPQPNASFTASPMQGVAPLTVNFNASSSTIPRGTISSYSWNFGDGSMGSGVTTSHSYKNAGNYTVTLTAKSEHGLEGTATLTIQVEKNQEPYASFTVSPASGRAPLMVTCNASGSRDDDGEIEEYEWQFGDGMTAQGEIVNHTYVSSGNYTITLTVTDDKGAHESTTQQVLVSRPIEKPVIGVDVEQITRAPRWRTCFDASDSYDPDGGPIISYQWTISGMNFSGALVCLNLWSPGRYSVSIRVVDDEGQISSRSGIVSIRSMDNEQKTINFSWSE